MPGGNIFLNYRRDDTAGHAGRLFDRLNWRFPGRVFRDVTGIGLGLDFVREVERKLADCHVLIVLIGRHWLTLTDGKGRRRLDNERDLVRLEVSAGLRRDIRVIPVLVGGAQMPDAEDLPADLRPLANRNALEITEPDFENDVGRLIRALEQALGEQPLRPAPAPRPGSVWKKLLAVGLLGGLAIAAAVAFFAMKGPGARPAPLGADPDGPTDAPRRPTPSTKTTPTPEASTADASDSDEFFLPAGRWVLTTEGSPYSIGLTLGADNSFVARAQGPGLDRTTRGGWAYLEGQRVLVLTGRDQWGNPMVDRIEIIEPHDNHFHVMYPGQGVLKMWPQ